MDINLFRKALASKQKLAITEAKLKMSPELYAELKKRISALKDKIPDHVEAIRKSDKFKDLGRRVRWDVYWATKMNQDHIDYTSELNDAHIDSALKQAFKELNIKDS